MDMMQCVAQRSKRKYIDADVMINELRELRTRYLIRSVFGVDMRDNAVTAGTLEAVAQILDGLPAADVVEVVRCKDCKHTDLFYPYCTVWEAAIDGDGYCYKGGRE